MPSRIQTAFQKLRFCYGITAGLSDFLKLLWNTKRWKWSKRNPSPSQLSAAAVSYQIQFGSKKTTLFLRSFAGDLDIFYELFWMQAYSIPGLQMNDFRMIVDLGSNTGLSVRWFLEKANQATIIGVEPETGNYELLLKNCEAAIGEGRVIPVQAAVLDSDGFASLFVPSVKYNTRVSDFETGNSVKTISLSSLFSQFNIESVDLLKIDTEGSERAIFSGEKRWLEKVSNIIIETHDDDAEKFCLDLLRKYGFQVSGPFSNDFSQSIYWAKKMR